MSESTAQDACTDAEARAALKAGLYSVEQGTNAFDAAIHRFAAAVRQQAVTAPSAQDPIERSLEMVPPARQFQVVPVRERIGGVYEIVAWELWADRKPAPYGWAGDLLDSFDSEAEACAARDAIANT